MSIAVLLVISATYLMGAKSLVAGRREGLSFLWEDFSSQEPWVALSAYDGSRLANVPPREAEDFSAIRNLSSHCPPDRSAAFGADDEEDDPRNGLQINAA